MYKIDKTLIDNMNINRSCIVITNKDTVRDRQESERQMMALDSDEQLSPAIREKARELMHSAQEKARCIVSEAEKEAEQIRQAAREQGYQAGLAASREEMERRIQTQNEQVRDVLGRVEQYRTELYDTLESDVLALSLDIAEKILNTQIQRDDNLFKEIVRKAVEGVKQADNFSLYVSQTEYDQYFKDGAQWLLKEKGLGSFEVIGDAKLPSGSCVIESDDEIIDAGIPMQFRKIGEYLKEQVE